MGNWLLGTHTSTGGNLLNGGDSQVGYVLQLFLSYVWIYLKVGWPKLTAEEHRVVGRPRFS